MSEYALDAPTEELKRQFVTACFFLAGAGVRRIPLAHGAVGEIEIGPGTMATYSVEDSITSDNQTDLLRRDITVYDDGTIDTVQEVEYLDEATARSVAAGYGSLTADILRREEELTRVSAVELQETIDFLHQVIKAVLDK